MKVFIDEQWDELSYVVEPLETDNTYLRQYGRVYELPKKLVRQHQDACKALQWTQSRIQGIIDVQGAGEPSPFKDNPHPPSPEPQFSIYQLRHVNSGTVFVELTVPSGASWDWQPNPGCEPEGWCQWYAQHMGDVAFAAIGERLRYDSYVVPEWRYVLHADNVCVPEFHLHIFRHGWGSCVCGSKQWPEGER